MDGWQWSAFLRRGSARGSIQLDADYPLRRPLFANVGGCLHLQYFNGYGETLLDYNVKRRSQFRVGFSVVRGSAPPSWPLHAPAFRQKIG